MNPVHGAILSESATCRVCLVWDVLGHLQRYTYHGMILKLSYPPFFRLGSLLFSSIPLCTVSGARGAAIGLAGTVTTES